MRSVPLVLLALLLAAAPAAQPAPAAQRASASQSAAHAVPFGSVGNEVALAVGGAAGGGWTVELVAAPAWVAVTRGVAEAVVSPERSASKADGGAATELGAEPVAEPVARVAFDVLPTAPVGAPGTLRLAVRDAAGAVVAEKTVRIAVAAPQQARLGLPRPNPSRGAVAIPYVVPGGSARDGARVRLRVLDVLGREVARLADGAAAPGAHEARLRGGSLAAGVYVVVLEAEGAEGASRAVRRLTVAE